MIVRDISHFQKFELIKIVVLHDDFFAPAFDRPGIFRSVPEDGHRLLGAFEPVADGFRKKNGHIMPYLKSIQGGMASIYPYFTNVPTAKEYWKFYPVNILFRDTMCFAPAEGKSLAILGNCVDVPKIILPEGVIGNMQPYLENNKDDFLAYAAQDALVTIMYGSRLWGINKEWCLTATSGSAFAMKQSISEYLEISKDKYGRTDNQEFNRIYRGYRDVKKGLISTPVGLRPTKAEEPISYEAGQLHMFAANATPCEIMDSASSVIAL